MGAQVPTRVWREGWWVHWLPAGSGENVVKYRALDAPHGDFGRTPPRGDRRAGDVWLSGYSHVAAQGMHGDGG